MRIECSSQDVLSRQLRQEHRLRPSLVPVGGHDVGPDIAFVPSGTVGDLPADLLVVNSVVFAYESCLVRNSESGLRRIFRDISSTDDFSSPRKTPVEE